MCEARHQRARVEIVDALFKQADGDHLPVHVDQPLFLDGHFNELLPFPRLTSSSGSDSIRTRPPLLLQERECLRRLSIPSFLRRWSDRTRGRSGSNTSCWAAMSASRSRKSSTKRPITTRSRRSSAIRKKPASTSSP